MTIQDIKENQQLASNLTKLLKNHKLSIDKLGNVLNIPPMTIRRIASGETADPRISTLQMIAKYFNISLDALMGDQQLIANDCTPCQVPIIHWNEIESFINSKDRLITNISKWQSIMLPKDEVTSVNLFALESKPSMYIIYPQGTIFVINSEVNPIDGDLILIKFIKDNSVTLRKLQIDPPELYLHQITLSNNDVIKYSDKTHSIVGIVVLTLLYNHTNIS